MLNLTLKVLELRLMVAGVLWRLGEYLGNQLSDVIDEAYLCFFLFLIIIGRL